MRLTNQPPALFSEAYRARFRPRTAAPRAAVFVVCTAVAAVLLVRVVDLDQLRASAARLMQRPDLLAAFLVTYSAAFWLRAIAWRRLLASTPGTWTLFTILQAALFANHVLPLKAGEVVRPYLLTRHGVTMTAATATTLVARSLDFLVLLVLAAMLLPVTADSAWLGLRLLVVPVVVLGVGSAGLLWLRASSGPLPLPKPLARIVQAAGGGLRAIPAARIASAALWTAPSWVLEGAVVIVAARTMGIDLSVPVAVAVTAVTILFQLVHLTPGGIGIYEATMAGALALHGIPLEQGVTLAVVAHGMKFAYALALGGACVALAARPARRGWAPR